VTELVSAFVVIIIDIIISSINSDICAGRKEQSFQAAVSSWMVQLETTVGYKDGLAEALSARCALLIQVLFCMHGG